MGVYFAGRSQPAEDLIWDQLDRMHNAGPVAAYYLAAHERRAWAMGTGRIATARTSMTPIIATAWRHRIGTPLKTLGRWLVGTSPVQRVDGDTFLATQHPIAS